MGKNNKKSLNEGQTGTDVMRTIKKSRRTGGAKSENAITRTTSLPMARTTSATSHSSTSNTCTDNEGGSQNEDHLEISVSPQDTSILEGSTPKRRSFVKNTNIKGIKSRLGWTPTRLDDKNMTNNVNRHGRR